MLAGAAAIGGRRGTRRSRRPPAREKGPLVWLDMDQKELDDAYDQAVYAPNARSSQAAAGQQRAGARAARRAQALRLRPDPDRGARRLHRPSGRTRRSTCSSTAARGAPALAKDYRYAAEMFVNAGAHFVVLDFVNVDRAAAA